MSCVTPGPWFAERDKNCWTVRAYCPSETPNHIKSVEVCRIAKGRIGVEAEADARAIARMPEAVELLRSIIAYNIDEDAGYGIIQTQAEALLRRIEGMEEASL